MNMHPMQLEDDFELISHWELVNDNDISSDIAKNKVTIQPDH